MVSAWRRVNIVKINGVSAKKWRRHRFAQNQRHGGLRQQRARHAASWRHRWRASDIGTVVVWTVLSGALGHRRIRLPLHTLLLFRAHMTSSSAYLFFQLMGANRPRCAPPLYKKKHAPAGALVKNARRFKLLTSRHDKRRVTLRAGIFAALASGHGACASARMRGLLSTNNARRGASTTSSASRKLAREGDVARMPPCGRGSAASLLARHHIVLKQRAAKRQSGTARSKQNRYL